jgi:hypothetical protein
MTNIERIKRAEPVIEGTIQKLLLREYKYDEASLRAGVVTAITALFPKEVRRGLK